MIIYVLSAVVIAAVVVEVMWARRRRAGAKDHLQPELPEPVHLAHPGTPDTEDLAQRVVETSYGVPVVVDFFATWCPPCQALGRALHQIAKEYAGRILVEKVDVDENGELAEMHGVRAMPTVMLFKGGECVARFEGYRAPDAIRLFLTQHGIRAA